VLEGKIQGGDSPPNLIVIKISQKEKEGHQKRHHSYTNSGHFTLPENEVFRTKGRKGGKIDDHTEQGVANRKEWLSQTKPDSTPLPSSLNN